jgi:hypothetical protein
MGISKIVRAKFRVKIKSLMEESRIIRKEEKRCVGVKRDEDRGCLRWHRVGIVRDEQRATLLALAFLRGVPYRVIEKEGSRPVDKKAVLRILESLAWKRQQSEALDCWLAKSMEKAA